MKEEVKKICDQLINVGHSSLPLGDHYTLELMVDDYLSLKQQHFTLFINDPEHDFESQEPLSTAYRSFAPNTLIDIARFVKSKTNNDYIITADGLTNLDFTDNEQLNSIERSDKLHKAFEAIWMVASTIDDSEKDKSTRKIR